MRYLLVTFPDRTQWLFEGGGHASPVLGSNSGNFFGITAIVDRNGHSLRFLRTSTGYAINNDAGTALLSVSYSNSAISTITDCYHRRVCYHVGTYKTTNVPSGYPQSYPELDHVSQVVPDSMTSGPDRYAYGYTGVSNGDAGTGAGETIPFLHSITVPTPSSANPASGTLSAGMSGTSSSYINYSPNTCYVSSLVDGNSNTRTYTVVDGTHTKVTVTNAQGQTVFSNTSGFDSYMSKQAETDGNNTPTYQVLSWDPNDPARPAQTKDGNGNVSSYTWDTVGNMTSMTPPSNSYRTPAKTMYTYRYTSFALGELTAVQEGSKTSTLYAYYEPYGLVSTIQTPVAGSVGSTTRSTTTYAYDGLGNVLTVKTLGNNATVVNGIDQGITTTYNYKTDGSYSQTAAIGQPLTVTDNLGEVTHCRYDSQGNLITDIDGVGWRHDYSYNIANQPLQTVDPSTGQTGTGRAYQQMAYAYPGGQETSTASYDESGSGAPVRQVYYAYGAEGETMGVSGSTEPVSYTYDALYRLVALTDSGNHTTSYSYNPAGYLYQMAYPGAGSAALAAGSRDTVTFTNYDYNGNVQMRVDGNGVVTSYAYNDPESLLTGISYAYPPTYGGGTTGNVSFGYDAYGRRAGMTDGSGSVTYNYDDQDNPLTVATTYSGQSPFTVSYSYYPDGSRQTMGTSEGAFTYAYDAVGRMAKLTDPYGEPSSWQYVSNGWLQKQTQVNGVTTSYGRDPRGEQYNLQSNKADGTLLSQYSVPGQGGYDGVENLTSVNATIPAAPSGYSGSNSYGYDTRSQLTGVTSTRFNGYSFGVGYDGGSTTGPGNPTSFRGTVHTYNADNQDTANTYDGNGNPTTYNGKTLQFDPENRMTAFGSAQTNGYNGDGLRAWKQTGSGRTYYIYDGDQVIGEFASGTSYLSALNTWGANGLLARHTRAGVWYYTFDMQGNVSQKLNAQGAVLSSSIFDPAGNQATNDPNPDPYSGFGGQWGYVSDYETGLTLLGHRFYDNSTQRFLTRDPIGYAGGINLYAYTTNNPVNNTDATGLFPVLTEPAPLPGIAPVLEGGGGAGLGTVLLTVGGVFGGVFGIAGPAGPVNEFPITDPRNPNSPYEKEKDREYDVYKALCDQPIKGGDPCMTLRLNIERMKKCIAARRAWDKKYEPGLHDTHIPQEQRELNNLIKKLPMICGPCK